MHSRRPRLSFGLGAMRKSNQHSAEVDCAGCSFTTLTQPFVYPVPAELLLYFPCC